MYFPEFSISTNILKNIGKIEASKAITHHMPIVPSWQKSLQREIEVKNTYHIHHFEQNPLSFEEVKAFFDQRVIDIKNKRALKEIENYKKALSLTALDLPVNEETLKSFHKTLLRDIAPENKMGFYRTNPTFIKGTNILAPAPDEILAQLRSFFTWYEGNDANELPTPLRLAILYFEILRISPFETENKKIAGLITLLTLYKDKYDDNKFLCIESYFDESPTNFYSIIRSTQNSDGDITRWIEYFLEGLTNEFTKIKDRVVNLAKDNKIRQVVGMMPLNDRQERIVEYLHDYGGMQNKDFVRLFPNVSEDTILRDLKDLMNKNLIVKAGSTKSARYNLNKSDLS